MPWLVSVHTRVPAAATESSPRHPYLLSWKGHDFASKLKAEAIFEVIQHLISYTLNGNALKGLEKYNDSTPYGCPESLERSLLRREGDRPVHFPSSNEAILLGVMVDSAPISKTQMAKWVVAEDSIAIECRQYVYAIIILTAVIVCGGISVPFAVRNRIAGVDPFQITLFSWIVATFVIFTAKSRYAAEWPWHEFLHGQVVCRSVKEVCDASGINAQTILMNLLLHEKDTVLRTRGPYNGMFSRKASNPDAFKINEAVHISTMMASGFIVLKVLNVFGELLVCLDVRWGSDFIRISQVGKWNVFQHQDDQSDDPMKRDDSDAVPG